MYCDKLSDWNQWDFDMSIVIYLTRTGRIVMGSRMAKKGHSRRQFPELHSKQWQNARC